MKKLICCAALILGLSVLVISGMQVAQAQTAANIPTQKEYRIERSMSPQAVACIECHKREHPGMFADWAKSRHASANISCLDCHQADPSDKDVSKTHFQQYERSDVKWGKAEYKIPVAAAVTPKDCSRCHPDEAKQYSRSKHANTLEIIWKIDPWLNKGMNSDFERSVGCFHCHGTILRMEDDKLAPEVWPNVGVGRLNFDGSKGSCTSCHTRHRFSVMEARKPEACGQCHLGPDHPQIEIFMESKHGDIYTAYGDTYNWDAAPGTWTAGVDYRAPTCAGCHMSGSGPVLTSHDVTERLAWETQAPLDDLYAKGLLDKTKFFDEHLEIEFYKIWHHEGRRARFGAAMMAPDYAWWHGFYDCKKRYNSYMEEARDMIKHNRKAYIATDFPNATGNTTRPKELFPE